MNAFKYNNPVIRVMIKIANLILVSFFWVIGCIPVITVVTSSAAMFHTVTKIINGTGDGVAKDFFSCYKNSFKQGILISLIVAATGALLFCDLYFGYKNFQTGVFAMAYFFMGIPLAFIWLSMVIFLPCVFSRFEGSPSVVIRLALYFASRNMLRTLLMLIVLVLVILLVDYYPVLLLILPGVYTDLFRNRWEKLMQKYIDDNGLEEETEAEETAESVPQELTSMEIDQLLKK